MEKKAATKKTVKPKASGIKRGKAKEKKKVIPRKRGRPSKYTIELADLIIIKIAGSSNGLDKICRETKELPDAVTVRKWLNEREDFLTRYTRARESQADFLADEITQISDEIAKRGVKSSEDVQAARLQVDARKWVAAKLKPKKYGESRDITTGGESLNKGFYDFLKEVAITNMSSGSDTDE